MKSFEKKRENKDLDYSYTVHFSNKKQRKFEFKKRSRKTGEQIKQLKEVYKTCTDWNKSKIVEIARNTGLSENQVYKWIWDQKRKSSKGVKI